MWIDYDVQRTKRRCSVTGRVIPPGEEFYSVLAPPEDDPASDLIERRDCSSDAWQGPPEAAIGWWRSRVANASQKPRLAPNEVLLELFDRWSDEPDRSQSRYVLTLLLVRRRVLKLADEQAAGDNEPSDQTLKVYCPDRDASYSVVVDLPDEERAAAIQTELFALLYDGPSSEGAAGDVQPNNDSPDGGPLNNPQRGPEPPNQEPNQQGDDATERAA